MDLAGLVLSDDSDRDGQDALGAPGRRTSHTPQHGSSRRDASSAAKGKHNAIGAPRHPFFASSFPADAGLSRIASGYDQAWNGRASGGGSGSGPVTAATRAASFGRGTAQAPRPRSSLDLDALRRWPVVGDRDVADGGPGGSPTAADSGGEPANDSYYRYADHRRAADGVRDGGSATLTGGAAGIDWAAVQGLAKELDVKVPITVVDPRHAWRDAISSAQARVTAGVTGALTPPPMPSARPAGPALGAAEAADGGDADLMVGLTHTAASEWAPHGYHRDDTRHDPSGNLNGHTDDSDPASARRDHGGRHVHPGRDGTHLDASLAVPVVDARSAARAGYSKVVSRSPSMKGFYHHTNPGLSVAPAGVDPPASSRMRGSRTPVAQALTGNQQTPSSKATPRVRDSDGVRHDGYSDYERFTGDDDRLRDGDGRTRRSSQSDWDDVSVTDGEGEDMGLPLELSREASDVAAREMAKAAAKAEAEASTHPRRTRKRQGDRGGGGSGTMQQPERGRQRSGSALTAPTGNAHRGRVGDGHSRAAEATGTGRYTGRGNGKSGDGTLMVKRSASSRPSPSHTRGAFAADEDAAIADDDSVGSDGPLRVLSFRDLKGVGSFIRPGGVSMVTEATASGSAASSIGPNGNARDSSPDAARARARSRSRRTSRSPTSASGAASQTSSRRARSVDSPGSRAGGASRSPRLSAVSEIAENHPVRVRHGVTAKVVVKPGRARSASRGRAAGDGGSTTSTATGSLATATPQAETEHRGVAKSMHTGAHSANMRSSERGSIGDSEAQAAALLGEQQAADAKQLRKDKAEVARLLAQARRKANLQMPTDAHSHSVGAAGVPRICSRKHCSACNRVTQLCDMYDKTQLAQKVLVMDEEVSKALERFRAFERHNKELRRQKGDLLRARATLTAKVEKLEAVVVTNLKHLTEYQLLGEAQEMGLQGEEKVTFARTHSMARIGADIEKLTEVVENDTRPGKAALEGLEVAATRAVSFVRDSVRTLHEQREVAQRETRAANTAAVVHLEVVTKQLSEVRATYVETQAKLTRTKDALDISLADAANAWEQCELARGERLTEAEHWNRKSEGVLLVILNDVKRSFGFVPPSVMRLCERTAPGIEAMFNKQHADGGPTDLDADEEALGELLEAASPTAGAAGGALSEPGAASKSPSPEPGGAGTPRVREDKLTANYMRPSEPPKKPPFRPPSAGQLPTSPTRLRPRAADVAAQSAHRLMPRGVRVVATGPRKAVVSTAANTPAPPKPSSKRAVAAAGNKKRR